MYRLMKISKQIYNSFRPNVHQCIDYGQPIQEFIATLSVRVHVKMGMKIMLQDMDARITKTLASFVMPSPRAAEIM